MVRRRVPLALAGAVIAALALAGVARVGAAPEARFSLAVLRRDGILIPFASFNGKAWSVPWPGAATGIPLPISLSDIPRAWWGSVGPAAPWTAWLPDDLKRPLKLEKPAHVPIFCGGHLAIRTDYRGAPLPEREPTVPKDGVATAGDVTVLPVVQVSVMAPDAAQLIKAITDDFNREEDVTARQFERWTHPYGPRARAMIPIELETFYRARETGPSGPYRTSYIEAVRRYPAARGENGCGLLTFVRGWVTEYADGRKPLINIGARVTYCDRAEVSFMQPFGRILLPGRGRAAEPEVYWVYQLSSWRDEFYSVARVTAEGVKPEVVVPGGGCPKEPER